MNYRTKHKNALQTILQTLVYDLDVENYNQAFVDTSLSFTDRQLHNTISIFNHYKNTFGYDAVKLLADPTISINSDTSSSTIYNASPDLFSSNYTLFGTNNNTGAISSPNITSPEFITLNSSDSQYLLNANTSFYDQGVIVIIFRTPTPKLLQTLWAKGGGIRSFIQVNGAITFNSDSGFITTANDIIKANELNHVVYAWDRNSATRYYPTGNTGGSAAIWVNGEKHAQGDGLVINPNASNWTISRQGSAFGNFDLFHYSLSDSIVTDGLVKSLYDQQTNTVQSSVYNSNNLAVEKYYITSANRYPYIFISSGELTPNGGSNSQYEIGRRGTYKRIYEYRINCVFRIEEADGATESQIDELESLIIDKLQGQSTRDSGDWLDLTVSEVTSPYQEDVTVVDNSVIKSFTVLAEELVDYPT